MSNSRVIRRPAPKPSSKSESSSGKWKWIGSVLLVLLVAAGAWAFLPSQDPALARIEDLRTQMDGANDEQRREIFRKMRGEFENLSEDSRHQLFEEGRKRWEKREMEHLNKFFALSPQEQVAEIDKDLKREAERRKQWEQRRAQAGNDGQGRGGAGGGGRGGWGGSRGNSSDPNARRKSYLDNTSAQQRAMRGEYHRMREERRKQLGK